VDAFRSRRALVIGGSRGLGEVVAKLLAAGGADVRLTYHRGESDARSVVEEITAGGGKAASFHLDVADPDRGMAALTADAWQPTHLYYFATPPIFRGGFIPSEALLDRFRQCYVIAFATVVGAAKARAAGRLSVFYPSSTAIDERPRAMNEYIAAKLEGEELCRRLVQDGGVDIHVERLPRLKTDQTATVMPVAAGDPLPLMAKILGKC
jgi:nucleoside-diphosphate-sugar epimerase